VKKTAILYMLLTPLYLACTDNQLGALQNVIVVDLNKQYLSKLPINIDTYFITRRVNRTVAEAFLTKRYDLNSKEMEDRICLFKSSKHDIEKTYAQIDKCAIKFQKATLDEQTIIHSVISGAGENNVLFGGRLRSKLNIDHGLNEEQSKLFVYKDLMKERIREEPGKIPTAKFMTLKTDELNDSYIKDGRLYQELIKVFTKDTESLVLKPTAETGSSGIKVFSNFKDLRDFASGQFYEYYNDILIEDFLHTEYILEEFIVGDVYRFDGYMYRGEILYNFLSKYKVKPLEFYQKSSSQMYSMIENQEENEKSHEFVTRVTKSLGYNTGVFHLEAIKKKGGEDDGKFYFLEIAARPGGGLNEALTLIGYDPIEAYINSQLGWGGLVEREKIEKTFDVVEIKTPISDSTAKHRLLSVDHEATSTLKMMQKEQSRLTIKKELVRPGNRIAFAIFIGRKSKSEQVHKEANDFYDSFSAKLRIRGGEHYFKSTTLKGSEWSEPE